MCTGITNGFAGVKLSGSPRLYGSLRVSVDRTIIIIVNPTMFLAVKYG